MKAPCPICGASCLWAWSSKGRPEALQPEPTDEGYIRVSEGFTHVYVDRAAAIADQLSQGFPFDTATQLHEPHFCLKEGAKSWDRREALRGGARR